MTAITNILSKPKELGSGKLKIADLPATRAGLIVMIPFVTTSATLTKRQGLRYM